jgi:hypothetical protein
MIPWRLALVAVSASIFFSLPLFFALFFHGMGGKRERRMLTMFVE